MGTKAALNCRRKDQSSNSRHPGLGDSRRQGEADAQGFYPAPTRGAAFTSYLRQQDEDYARIIRDANITGE
jgi:hypothetical protein